MRASRWERTCAGVGLGQRVRMAAERSLGAAELRELNRIGVNLNQMARAMNSGAGTPAGTREEVERVGELVAAPAWPGRAE